LLDLSIY